MSNKRIAAAFLDFIICCIIQFILFFIFVMLPLFNNNLQSAESIINRVIIITFISMFYLIFRDVLGNKSIGKRIMKLKIIDSINNEPVSVVRRILRNITWLLNWIEIIIFFVNKGNRIGDIWAKTKIIDE